MDVCDKILIFLEESKCKFKLSIHEPVRTSEEAAKVRGVDIKTGAKAMVVKSKNDYYLLVLPANKNIDWKKVKKEVQIKEVRFATTEEAEQITGVQMGSDAPFGNILGLKTFFDKELMENEYLNFNIGRRTHSVQLKSKDLVTLVKPIIVDITKLE